jgi:hypothetical protein
VLTLSTQLPLSETIQFCKTFEHCCHSKCSEISPIPKHRATSQSPKLPLSSFPIGLTSKPSFPCARLITAREMTLGNRTVDRLPVRHAAVGSRPERACRCALPMAPPRKRVSLAPRVEDDQDNRHFVQRSNRFLSLRHHHSDVAGPKWYGLSVSCAARRILCQRPPP